MIRVSVPAMISAKTFKLHSQDMRASLNSCIRGRKDGYATDDLPERSDCIQLLREQLVSGLVGHLSEK